MKKQHLHVKRTLKAPRMGALDKIVVPQPVETTDDDPDKITWCPVTDPSDVEDVLFRQNHRHFLQSTISVFARGPISELLGEDCSNGDEILEGNIDIATIAKAYGHLEEATTLLLKEMKRRTTEDGTPAAVPTIIRKLQLWQNLLNASGGDLAIDKCVIVFLLYKTIFHKGNSLVVLKTNEEEPGDISLQPFNQEADRINIRRINTAKGERYL